jgi:hypothetical protein
LAYNDEGFSDPSSEWVIRIPITSKLTADMASQVDMASRVDMASQADKTSHADNVSNGELMLLIGQFSLKKIVGKHSFFASTHDDSQNDNAN